MPKNMKNAKYLNAVHLANQKMGKSLDPSKNSKALDKDSKQKPNKA